MSEKINLFFESMAERLTNENDLSDITYALCKTDNDFRKFFLEYCFEEAVDTDNLIREYAKELVTGYLSYLREVIHVKEFEEMDIRKISCLPILLEI